MANFLTFSRIGLLLPFIACYFTGGATGRWLAAGIFVIAGLTDFFDGYLARKLNQTSALGAALDPIADKLLSATAIVLLIMDQTLTGFHVVIALMIILRELWVAGLREALAGTGSLPVTRLAKWKTAAQFLALALLLVPAPPVTREAGIFFLWAGAALTVWTGFIYTNHAIGQLRNR